MPPSTGGWIRVNSTRIPVIHFLSRADFFAVWFKGINTGIIFGQHFVSATMVRRHSCHLHQRLLCDSSLVPLLGIDTVVTRSSVISALSLSPGSDCRYAHIAAGKEWRDTAYAHWLPNSQMNVCWPIASLTVYLVSRYEKNESNKVLFSHAAVRVSK